MWEILLVDFNVQFWPESEMKMFNITGDAVIWMWSYLQVSFEIAWSEIKPLCLG